MEDNTNKKMQNRRRFISFLKWMIFTYLVLFVLFAALGISPIGAREINNAFFSLFIFDDRSQNSPQDVSVSLDTNGITADPAQTNTNAQAGSSNGGVGAVIESSGATLPVEIVIPKVSLEGRVLNPTSTESGTLDTALLYGAVRYPGSGELDSDKNILIFGHNSGLPVVHNQNFKIFGGLKNLSAGDDVYLKSKTRDYHYKVMSVRQALADEELVTFSNDHKLILSTCNTFAGKEVRYVVEAYFVGSSPSV